MRYALNVHELRKAFPGGAGVNGVSFHVAPGEVYGVVGPNGAGKSTVLNLILGLLKPDGGTVELLGSDLRDPVVRAKLGSLPDGAPYPPALTGRELVTFAGRLHGLAGSALTQKVSALLELAGLSAAADRALGSYSKGMKQRAGLAQALVNDPELLFMDEPMDGLDPLGRIRMRETVAGLKARGCAVVFTTHILSDVELICDRVAVMDAGRLLAEGTPEGLAGKKGLEAKFLELVGA